MIAVAAAACVSACSITEPQHGIAKAHRGAPNATRFAVLPTNALVEVSPELSEVASGVLGYITHYLRAQGRERKVIDQLQTRSLWLASVSEASRSDTASHDFFGAIQILSRKLGGATAFDALVVSTLVYRKAWLRNRLIKWDGVVRRVPDGDEESTSIPESFAGGVPAVSLHVMVFAASGELVFENYGGIGLAHALTMEPGEEGGLAAKLLDTVVPEHRFLREGVEQAFDPYLPIGRAVDW